MKHVEAQTQVRAGDFFNERRGRLQIIRIGCLGLKLQSEPHAALAGFDCCLNERHLQPFEILLAERPKYIAGDDQCFDFQ